MREIPSERLNVFGRPTHWTIDGVQVREPRCDLRQAEYVGDPDEIWAVFARDVRKGKYEGCSIYSAFEGAAPLYDGITEMDRMVTVLFDGLDGDGPTWGDPDPAELLARLNAANNQAEWQHVLLSPDDAARAREWAAKGHAR